MFMKRLLSMFLVIGYGIPVSVSFPASDQQGGNESQEKVTITMRPLKDIYEVGETVQLVLAIVNHSEAPIYSFLTESDFHVGFCEVMDANGARVAGDAIPTPVPPPPYYYMQKDGKRVYTVPVHKIDGHGVWMVVMKDALRRYHGRISPGTYFLSVGDIELLQEVGEVIVREGLPERLWVDPQSQMSRMRCPVKDVKIEIREPDRAGGPLERHRSGFRAWSSFAAGGLCGIVVVLVGLALKRRLPVRS